MYGFYPLNYTHFLNKIKQKSLIRKKRNTTYNTVILPLSNQPSLTFYIGVAFDTYYANKTLGREELSRE